MNRTKAVVLAKLETAYGVDPTPTSGANAILCELPEFEVLGKKLERNFTRGFYGTLPPVNVGEGLKLSFTTELKGGGLTGAGDPVVYAVIAPEIDPLLQICNFTKETLNDTNSSILYTPNSDDTTPSFAANRVSNGTFTTDLTGWTGANWAYSSGKARHTAGAITALTQAGTTGTVGRTEKLSFAISNRTAGTVKIEIGGEQSASYSATPTSAVYLTPTTTGALKIVPSSDFDGDIDNVTCQAISSGSVTAKSAVLYFYQHNILHKMLGCKGSLSLDLKVNEYAKIKFEFTGIYAGPVDTVIPASPTYNSTLPPVYQSALFTLDSYAAIISNLKLDIKNEIAKRVDANAATGILEYYVKGRTITGECDPEVPSLDVYNFWSKWDNSTQVHLVTTLGASSGNQVVIDAPQVVFETPKYADREGLLTHALSMMLCASVGNDEITLKFA